MNDKEMEECLLTKVVNILMNDKPAYEQAKEIIPIIRKALKADHAIDKQMRAEEFYGKLQEAKRAIAGERERIVANLESHREYDEHGNLVIVLGRDFKKQEVYQWWWQSLKGKDNE